MKRLLKTLTLAAIVGAAFTLQTSCGPDPVADDPELLVSTDLVGFGAEAGDRTIHIKTNVRWTISGAEALDWLTVTPSSGEGTGTIPVKVAVTANPLSQPRSATLTVTAGALTETVNVTQGYADVLDVENARIEDIPAEGATVEVKLKTSDAPTVAIGKDWITADGTGTPSGDYNTVLKFKVDPAISPIAREGTITFSVGEIEKSVTLVQSGVALTIPADAAGMDDDAVAMAAKMGLGWNFGNTMEPPGGEGSWGRTVSKRWVETVADAGFKSIRLPCAWDSHIIDRDTYEIDPAWLDRVAQVVTWCLEEDLYVMVNIHWDGGWLEEHPYYADQEAVNRQQKALWEQIAVRMRDFDQKLIFAGTNEVHHGYDAPRPENIEVQESFNQTFVDAVRSTGGKNAYRNLVVQGYNTNIDYTVQYMTMPDDNATGRLMTEVHYYDPYEFTIANDSNTKLVWGNRPEAPIPGPDSRKANWGDENFADGQFAKMKTNFVDKGIPVLVGEYGISIRTGLSAQDKADHDASNAYYVGYVTRAMVASGLVPMYWDTVGGGGLFDPATFEPLHPDILAEIMSAKQ